MRAAALARQSDSAQTAVIQEEIEFGPPPSASHASDSSSLFQLPKVDSTVALTARLAGRMNAAAVSEGELRALLAERQKLLDKKFAGSLSAAEAKRLKYVRWSLDRIEDARHGQELDMLEEQVVKYERFLRRVDALELQLKAHLPGR